MHTYCVRKGQVEVAIIEHDGHEFSALGASVFGRSVTGYTRFDNGDVVLTTWCGKTTLNCRCEIVERYWSGSSALMFRLPHGRYIVGYSLGDGMLFRGELLTDSDEDEARQTARQVSDCFAELDAEDEAEFQDQMLESAHS